MFLLPFFSRLPLPLQLPWIVLAREIRGDVGRKYKCHRPHHLRRISHKATARPSSSRNLGAEKHKLSLASADPPWHRMRRLEVHHDKAQCMKDTLEQMANRPRGRKSFVPSGRKSERKKKSPNTFMRSNDPEDPPTRGAAARWLGGQFLSTRPAGHWYDRRNADLWFFLGGVFLGRLEGVLEASSSATSVLRRVDVFMARLVSGWFMAHVLLQHCQIPHPARLAGLPFRWRGPTLASSGSTRGLSCVAHHWKFLGIIFSFASTKRLSHVVGYGKANFNHRPKTHTPT